MEFVQSARSVLLKYRWLVIAVALVPNLLALSIALLTPKSYEAAAWILIGGNRASQAMAAGDEQKAGPDQILRTQISIALSEEVIRQTIRRFKLEELVPAAEVSGSSQEENENTVYRRIRNDISATIEPNTFVVKLSFRNRDPKIAAEFTNKLVAVFLSRRAEVWSNPGAAEFFNRQESQYNRDLTRAAEALEQFSTRTGTYAIDEQKRLTLTRRDNLLAVLGSTQGSIKRVESQAESMRYQIAMLKTRITLPPEIFGSTNFQQETPKGGKSNDALWSDPPLLHVKLYQQMAEKLVEANAELSGLRALEAQQRRDLAAIDGQLQTLASRETEFQRLHRDVTRASSYIESFRRKSLEARMDTAWLMNEAFSAVQVIQNATVPLDPSSPKTKLILAMGLSVGLLLAGALIYVLAGRPEAESKERTRPNAALAPAQPVRLKRVAEGPAPVMTGVEPAPPQSYRTGTGQL